MLSDRALPPSGPSPERFPLRRRTLLAGGASASVALLALSACTDEDAEPGPQEPDTDEVSALKVVYSENPNARGDWTVWSVSYDLAEDQEAPPLYDASTQQARHEALEAKKAEKQWTVQDPLVVLDPYGSTRTGLYVHFEDAAGGRLDVLCQAASTEDFAHTAANHAAGTGFEGLVIGAIPGAHNTLTVTWRPEGGDETAAELRIKAPTTASGYGTAVAAEIVDADALTPGLFALGGVTDLSNNTYLFDNTGIMRAELHSGDTAAHHVVPEDGRIVTTTGSRQLGVLDPFGHATTLIDLGEHSVHHDLAVVDDLAYLLTSLASSGRVEDRVIRVDLGSGAVEEVVDLQKVLPEYESLAHAQEGEAGGSVVQGKDWIHINSIDITDGVMILSARETSTIIALDDALDPGSEPSVRWMIGVEALWEGTGYEEHFLTPEGDVIGNAGQHTVHRIDDDALPDGQFYLEMFNNNYWRLSTREDADWQDVGPDDATTDEHDGASHALRYVVDENASTFRQDEAVELPYSSVVSNVNRLGDGGIDQPMVTNSGRANEYSERSADGTVLASYRYDSASHGYRVYKAPFDGFWFTAT
ncbi:MAG: aryl-sulfate sulfotransferase [Brachybacterium sp.]|uniref:aryl-sulfate sulfotransferase n=1 Tax=Brachybacterium sp. TaxID=1891286 RepID=UPI0026494DA4|nr:aryl-sulfate sulfotransferase [Brachybacterium sp.]MDN5687669.1 aryl-sulfate sulfotransferase [Brachybacterium sp.]